MFQAPGIVQLKFMVAPRSYYALVLKRTNFGKAISLRVRYSRTQDNAEGSGGKIRKVKTGAQRPGVKSTAIDQSDCPHLLYFISRDYSFFYVKQKAETRRKAFASRFELCRRYTRGQKYGTLHELRVILAQGPC